MKKIILLGLVALMATNYPGDVSAVSAPTVEVEAEVTKTDRQVVEDLVSRYAPLYGVSASSMMRTLSNENDTFEPCRQSGLTYREGNRWGFPAGAQERSFGVAQIHLPDNPTVTKEQACDPDFAVKFMAEAFAKGHQRRWSGYAG